MMSMRSILCFCLVLSTFACTAQATKPNNALVVEKEGDGDKGKKNKGGGDEGDGDDDGSLSKSNDEPASPEAAKAGTSAIFAHGPRAMYEFEPKAGTFKVLEAPNCLKADEELVDLAVSGKGSLFATTWGTGYSRFLSIDPTKATCTQIAEKKDGEYPNALSFVPKGTVDANEEALVGYDNRIVDGSNVTFYERIDLKDGKITEIGQLQKDLVSLRYESSGDIVSLEGGKSYLTGRLAEPGSADVLLEVNPKTGEIIKVIGSTGFQQLYGLAYWEGSAYGFSGTGQVVKIDVSTGKGTLVEVPLRPAAFYGAAVTTVAPK
jgi:hypothetical protein